MSLGRLPVASSVSPSDGVAVYSRTLQGDVLAPVSALANALRAALVPVDGVQVQRAAPTSGATVTVANLTTPSKLIMLTPASALASLTVAFPAGVNSIDGQLITLYSTAAITALTITSVGATVLMGGTLPTTYRFDGVVSAWVPVTGGGGGGGPVDDWGYRNLRRVTYTGASTVQVGDNGKAHFKTTADPVTVPTTLPDEFMTTVINWSDDTMPIEFTGAVAYGQDGQGLSGSTWSIPARCTATLVHVAGDWMIAGPVAQV